MEFDVRAMWTNLPFLLSGAEATLKAALFGMFLATILGIFFGLIGTSGSKQLRLLQQAYAYVIRGIPMLVLLFLVYFALPIIGVSLPSLAAGVISLGLNSGAYVSEVVRSGIESIERDQWEAAALDGASSWQAIWKIIFPQTLRRITAPATNELISLIKNSSLLAVIAVFELTRAAQIVASREFIPFEMYVESGLIYLLIVSVLARISYFFEHTVFAQAF
jgi:His/Glu/Gln/Arg/opine family amino acid ABC transporter permease subunit